MIASDSTCRVVQEAVDKLAAQMLFSEQLESRAVSPESAELGSSVTSQSLAYIIPTSVSTGTPKACAVTHVNATAFLTEATAYYRLSSFDKKLQAANFAFDVSVFDIWGTLSVGGCVVGASKEDMFGDMTAVIQQASCTFLDLTPTWRLFCPQSSCPLFTRSCLEESHCLAASPRLAPTWNDCLQRVQSNRVRSQRAGTPLRHRQQVSYAPLHSDRTLARTFPDLHSQRPDASRPGGRGRRDLYRWAPSRCRLFRRRGKNKGCVPRERRDQHCRATYLRTSSLPLRRHGSTPR